MKFEPQLLDEIRNRLSISTVVGRVVQWDRRKSNIGKGDLWACCPFHGEKTPSFHVEDRKGRYHCFGCKASGDIFRFVMETEGSSFPETVERLAEEAGVKLPEQTPQERHKARVRATLHDVMKEAAGYFHAQLYTVAGRAARDYLAGREIPSEVIREFGVGFAPGGRATLRDFLAGKGVTDEQMVECGLAIAGDDGESAFDRFRDRIMFPIHDSRSRVVAFGGRAMSQGAKAKYLNSPETPIFHKGGALYNYDRARPVAHQTSSLFVVEGYFDVIAMHRAGINAVAPLGTALTADQISLLWRTTAEPVLCFDGDAAGVKAAWRAADLAIPLLTPGHSFSFVFLPDGMDPDDMLRTKGADPLRQALTQTKPLLDVLWDRASGENDRTTPERAALFEQALFQKVEEIQDATVRAHYRKAVKDKLRGDFVPVRPKAKSRGNDVWRAGQSGEALLGALADMEKNLASVTSLRDEGCFDE